MLYFFNSSCYNSFQFTGNILVAGGQLETKNRRVGKCNTTAKLAAARETSTRLGATAR
ncbi:MAG: hypothetical protein MGU50_12680 [Trichodesmium sp. MAG_R02]|nr:hypothetical protein [Trichodesmium sp. MAG_R02]